MNDYNLPTIGLLNNEVIDTDKVDEAKMEKIVTIGSLLSSSAFQESDMELPMAVGCDVSNDVFMADLSKLRHLLVAGATATGKSVCLHNIIASLLYKKNPTQLKFVLIDHKKCEFGVYLKLENHYLAKLPKENEAIVTSVDNAVEALSSLCVEMEERINLLMSAGVRNIKEYNKKLFENCHNSEVKLQEMPYIVVVIDEYSDLVVAKGTAVEEYIIRLAQRAHVVGIHLILATQRLSSNVITGRLKANFHARIACRALTSADSRTILDREGAQLLNGNGDMLFYVNGQTDCIQGAYISSSETERICEFIRQQPAQSEPYLLPIPNNNEAFN